jgi:hypothetical protein
MTMTGAAPLYLPPYDAARLPIEYSARCVCGLRYLVFNPQPRAIGDAETRARERADAMRRRFVNSSVEPFVKCPCGQALDFSTVTEAAAVM